MSEARINLIAKSIKEAAYKFRAPVYIYIEPEAQERWEERNPNGDWYQQPECADELESYRIIARAVDAALAHAVDRQDDWIDGEREATIAVLRSLCGDFGDNDWPDDLHLADVVEKHLGKHLHVGESSKK